MWPELVALPGLSGRALALGQPTLTGALPLSLALGLGGPRDEITPGVAQAALLAGHRLDPSTGWTPG